MGGTGRCLCVPCPAFLRTLCVLQWEQALAYCVSMPLNYGFSKSLPLPYALTHTMTGRFSGVDFLLKVDSGNSLLLYIMLRACLFSSELLSTAAESQRMLF